jgi:hypothetical protein
MGLGFPAIRFSFSGLFTTNEPKPVLKIEKGGQYAPDSVPTRQSKGGQDAPDFATHFSTLKGVSICRIVTQNTCENPEKY